MAVPQEGCVMEKTSRISKTASVIIALVLLVFPAVQGLEVSVGGSGDSSTRAGGSGSGASGSTHTNADASLYAGDSGSSASGDTATQTNANIGTNVNIGISGSSESSANGSAESTEAHGSSGLGLGILVQFTNQVQQAHESFTAELRELRAARTEAKANAVADFNAKRQGILQTALLVRAELRAQAASAREELKSEQRAKRVSAAQKILFASVAHAEVLLAQASAKLEISTADEATVRADDDADVVVELTDLAALRAELAQEEASVRALSATSTNAEIRAEASKVRILLAKTRAEVEASAAVDRGVQLRGIVTKLDQEAQKTDSLLQRAARKGVDVSAYQSTAVEIKTKLSGAQADLRAAMEAKARGDVKTAHEFLSKVHAEARDAASMNAKLHADMQADARVNGSGDVRGAGQATAQSTSEVSS